MSNIEICDLCGQRLMQEFTDKGYKVTVKELKHSYDGYNPWVSKSRLSICHVCMKKLVNASPTQNDGEAK